ncbi:MAG: hypothetical protein ABSB95_00970 [Dissulfurispiraceae bacterium]|jgi:hypothetical protein
MKSNSKLIAKFMEDITAQEGIEKAIRKQEEIEQQVAVRKALEDNIKNLEQERALEKKKQIGEAIAARKAFEDNAKKMQQAKTLEKKSRKGETEPACKVFEDNAQKIEQALKEAERTGVFIQSSIYEALKKHNHVNKGDTISVVRMTSREPVSLVIITVESRQELIPFHERNYSQDFRTKSELGEDDQSKEWVQVDDRIACKQYFIVGKR